MNIRTALVTTGLIAASLVSGAAQAALQGRDLNGSAGSFEAYYDTDLDITWLADANYAQTSFYDFDGKMTRQQAAVWAAGLSFTDGVNVYDNWRLPISNDGCAEGDSICSSLGMDPDFVREGELKSLFTTLGGVDGSSITAVHNSNFDLFQNIQGGIYWYGTLYQLDTEGAWAFRMQDGIQVPYYELDEFYAWAVSPGDVGAVPEAQTYALMLAGLGLIGWRARRRELNQKQ